ncbi:MAG: glycosyltransferase [Parcubacteria group bacterium]
MSQPIVTINIVVWNATKLGDGRYIRPCLDSIKKQTYKNIEVNLIDNNSSDDTLEIIKKDHPEFNLIERKDNPGLWTTQNEALEYSKGEYIIALSLDTILNPHFVENAVTVFEKDKKIGSVQAKVYSYDSYDRKERMIDTVGFKMFCSRRLINEGHGEADRGQYNKEKQIFGVEGAVPIFRKKTLEDIKIEGSFADPDYFWYGDDFDLAWRITLFGWKQIYSPEVIAYHDRATTKDISHGLMNHMGRIGKRKSIPLKKRRLDWANTRFTIIKNDYIVNILRDLPWIIARELGVFFYTLFIEAGVFLEYPRFFRLLPGMLRKRKETMKKAKISASQMRGYISK